MRCRSGSVLILAVWSLAVLGLLVVAVGGYVSASISMARYLKNNNAAYFLARAGVELAVAEIMNNPENYGGTTIADLVSMEDLFRDNATLQGGVFSVSYTIDDTNTSQIVTNYGVLRETAKIDITSNDTGTRRRLTAIIEQLGAQGEIVDNIINRYPEQKEVDSVTSNRFGAYDGLSELLAVPGVTGKIFDALERLITLRRFKRWYPASEGDEWIPRDSYGGLSEGRAMVMTLGGRKEIAATLRISFVFDSATTNFLSWREH